MVTIHFPYLETLHIETDRGFVQSDLSPHFYIFRAERFDNNEMVLPLLQMNPQLRDLEIRSFNLNTDLIRIAIDSLQNIKKLVLEINPFGATKTYDNLMHMKNVKNFDISFRKMNQRAVWFKNARFLPFSFNQLEKFCICFPLKGRAGIQCHKALSEDFFKFIEKYSTINHLKIHAFGGVDWSRLTQSVPQLVEFDLFNVDNGISINEAIDVYPIIKC